MRILVTGARGFVGKHALAEFHANGHETLVAVQYEHELGQDPAARLCDILSPEAVNELLCELKPDACLHLAGMAFVPAAWDKPHLAFEVNLIGTLNMLEAIRRHSPGTRFLLASTSQIYGSSKPVDTWDEFSPTYPDSLYGVTKLAADLTTTGYAHRHGLKAMTARPANHIGPGQSPDFVMPSFALQLAEMEAGKREKVIKVGNLESEREFTDVRDVVRAYRLLLERGQPGESYNVSSGQYYKIRFLLDSLCDLCGIKPAIEVDPGLFRPVDRQPSINTDKLRKETGWAPLIPLEKTLTDILNDMRNRVKTRHG